MINMYRFGLAPKFTGIAVAAVLSTGILVSLTMFYESPHRLREQIIDNNESQRDPGRRPDSHPLETYNF